MSGQQLGYQILIMRFPVLLALTRPGLYVLTFR